MKFLGNIVAAASTAENNKTTGTPFAIPPGAKYVEIQVVADIGESGDPCYAEIGAANDFQTTTDTGYAFSSTTPLELKVPDVPNPVLSLYNGNGSNPKTFRVLASAGLTLSN